MKEEIIENIRYRIGKKILNWEEPAKDRVYATFKREDLIEVARYLFEELDARLATASGVDTRKAIEVLYHFAFDRIGLMFTVKIILEKPDIVVESITPVIRGAEWIEREIHEMLGVDFKNHPNLKHLLLKEDWPEGHYPLRRDR